MANVVSQIRGYCSSKNCSEKDSTPHILTNNDTGFYWYKCSDCGRNERAIVKPDGKLILLCDSPLPFR
jgi:uncharacterized Zn finger protein